VGFEDLATVGLESQHVSIGGELDSFISLFQCCLWVVFWVFFEISWMASCQSEQARAMDRTSYHKS